MVGVQTVVVLVVVVAVGAMVDYGCSDDNFGGGNWCAANGDGCDDNDGGCDCSGGGGSCNCGEDCSSDSGDNNDDGNYNSDVKVIVGRGWLWSIYSLIVRMCVVEWRI